VSSFRVEPANLHSLAGELGNLIDSYEGLGNSLDLSDTGDPNLARAIEDFVDQANGGFREVADQFAQLQRILTATANGYETVDSDIVANIESNLSDPGEGGRR
jgi:hypothetical protein